MRKNDYNWFTNKECRYFPCHETENGELNCMFCYCPLYPLKNCGGEFCYTGHGIKDCSHCLLPHTEEGLDHVAARMKDLADLVRREPQESEKKEG